MKKILLAIIIISLFGCMNIGHNIPEEIKSSKYCGVIQEIDYKPGFGSDHTQITTDQTTILIFGTPILTIGDSCFVWFNKPGYQHSLYVGSNRERYAFL